MKEKAGGSPDNEADPRHQSEREQLGLPRDAEAGTTDQTAGFSIRAAAAIAERQAFEASRPGVAYGIWNYLAWGTSWFLSYLLLWTSTPQIGVTPEEAGNISVGILFGTTMVVTIAWGFRLQRGLGGKQRFQKSIFGWSYFLGSFAAGMIGGGLMSAGLDPEIVGQVYFAAIFPAVIGLIQLLSSALWYEKRAAIPAIGLVLAGPISTFIPRPHNILFVALVAALVYIGLGTYELYCRVHHNARIRAMECAAGLPTSGPRRRR